MGNKGEKWCRVGWVGGDIVLFIVHLNKAVSPFISVSCFLTVASSVVHGHSPIRLAGGMVVVMRWSLANLFIFPCLSPFHSMSFMDPPVTLKVLPR